MMYIHSNNEIDKRINVSKIANNISTVGDNNIATWCNSRLITVLVQGVRLSCRTTFLAQHFRPSGVLSCRPNGLGLTPGFYPGSNEQHRLF